MTGTNASTKHTIAPLMLGVLLSSLALGGCVGTPYSGPVEVTRFISQQSAEAGGGMPGSIEGGPIAITFPQEMSNSRAKEAFYDAVAGELVALGYAIADEGQPGIQSARIETTRSPLAPASSRGPVSVGVGGSAGSFGSGLGVGIGIDLGGNTSRPNALSLLSVRISDKAGNSIWEGRAQQAVSINSPYAEIEASARALAGALFKDFPGGNGETIEIDVDDLQN